MGIISVLHKAPSLHPTAIVSLAGAVTCFCSVYAHTRTGSAVGETRVYV